MQRKTEKKKLNNQGFSLLEVLIAMVILCIVSVPLLHSFVTTAKTNAKAKVLFRATDCAENMMEIAEYRTVDELVQKYSVNPENTIVENAGEYTFTIANPNDFPIELPDGYQVKMTLNPNLYPNANALNIADVKSISVSDTAVYEMPVLYDKGIYKKFDVYNQMAHEDHSLLYQRVNEDYFKQNLTRTIEITVDKKGSNTDENGNVIDLVTVTMDIHYYFRDKSLYQNYLPADKKEYKESTKELFNNLTTKEPLSGIFLFYMPRYLATNQGNKDNIIINNPDNVSVNVMIAPQMGADDASYKGGYFNAATGPNITVAENPAGALTDADAAITLFTNLSSDVPYSAIAPEGETVQNGDVLCHLTYQNPSGSVKITGEDAAVALDTRDLDGKVLFGSNVKTRIYKIVVSVIDQYGETIVELDGTKLE